MSANYHPQQNKNLEDRLDRRNASHHPEPSTRITEDGAERSLLRSIEEAFRLLSFGPDPLTLDGSVLGFGLPARLITLDELRGVLLESATSMQARDAVWRVLIERARIEEAWMTGCVGMALPGLSRIVARLRYGMPDTCDLDSEVLAGFIAAVRTIPLARDRLALRLCRAARTAAIRAHHGQAGPTPLRPDVAEKLAPPVVPGHPDVVLADAVTRGVISRLDAYLIGETRLGEADLADLAAELGLSYWAAAKRRRRAEHALLEAIHSGRLNGESAG